ncbi:MAG: hypothetical protein APR62_11045 [Smithella sp. SDB]|nr:MAG: hypothetical protein APR62_11045 [Smithella sp. SDB]
MGVNRSKPAGPQMRVKILLLICLSIILCSCTFHEQYPPDWAPLVKPSKDCWTITGMYNDDSSKKQHPLSYVLTGTRVKSPDLNKSNYVQINKGDNDVLIVTVWNENTRLAEKIYKKDDYTCSDEGIEISKGVEVIPEVILGLGRDKYTLMRAADGALVVMYGSSGFGLFGALIPVAVDEIHYYKYSQKK